MIVILVIVSSCVFFFLFSDKVFLMNYEDDIVSFKYYNNYKVKKGDNGFIIISKDGVADIIVNFNFSDTIYTSSLYRDVSSKVSSEMIDSNLYKLVSDNCVDHMCTSVYEDDKKKVSIVVEFREKIMVVYKFSIVKEEFDKYEDGFSVIVNSLVIESDAD